ncbi:hypothetical protein [Nibribacter koreensis]|uniref:Uncharacterized protein n=1 Tax=Nibribacter koreensis TaxID=1084519 RepID=A0ABP8F9T7_9BACT
MKQYLPTLLALGFFAGIFLLAFSSSDTQVAMYRVIGFVGFACAAGLVAIYWNRLVGTSKPKGVSRMEAYLRTPGRFSNQYGGMYELTDRIKAMRQKRHRPTLFNH